MTRRYPNIRVRVRSSNPLAVISAVRSALRPAGTERAEIESFSRQAFTSRDLDELRQVCRSWVVVEAPALAPAGGTASPRQGPAAGSP